MAERRGTPIDPGIIARATRAVSGAVGGLIRGVNEAWFGPAQPMAVVAPEDVRGRAFDYAVGYNLNGSAPRSEQGSDQISFQQLRDVAEPTRGGLDLLRLVIETRKDQMEAQDWDIKGVDGSDGGARAKAIKAALRKPDQIHTWSQWMRMILEDLLVLDAPAIYLCPSVLGYLLPEVIDGATIKPLLRPDGRTPTAPDPAYQQVLKGVPAVDYTTDEMIYMPRNVRSHRVYGMSPVEQVVTTINIAIRRQIFQLEYYTAGSVPDVLLGAPASWSQKQLLDFQNYWDSLLSGNTAERRRARFVPGDVKPFELKAGALKDEYDEWIARVVCFCFSVSPTAFTKATNRATAETAKQAAQEEGLEPLKRWFRDFMNEILARAFGADDLTLVWIDEEIADPSTKASVMATALGAGGGKPWLTVDEVRAKYGEQPMTPEQKDELFPPPPPALEASTDGSGPPEPEPDAKSEKLADALLALSTSLAKSNTTPPAPTMRQRLTRKLDFKRDPDTGLITGATFKE